MCGRFGQHYTWREIWELYNLTARWNLQPSWNIAPTQEADVLIAGAGSGGLSMARMRFGLVPHWARDEKIAYKTINARAETLAQKPAFREAFRQRRCIVPASGFYEWTEVTGGKQPHYITRVDGAPISFAGLWERWRTPGGEELLSFAIVTTQANTDIGHLHHRMPVVLERETAAAWIDAGEAGLLSPAPAGTLMSWPVSKDVNSPRNNHPALVEQVEEDMAGAKTPDLFQDP